MQFVDWIIVAVYIVFALLIGVWFTKKASKSTDDFFVAGRSLPWYVAGTSMVATTFSSDTPLFVSGIVREQGIYANWIWWGGMVGIIISVFFFAKLWRRSEAVTEIEFISQRYEPSKAANSLRVFKALFDGVIINCIIMASVTLAMAKIIVMVLDFGSAPMYVLPFFGAIGYTEVILIGLAFAAVFYTALSGLYGVVYTDLIQFALAMVGSIALAVIAWLDLESKGGFVSQIQAAPGYTPDTLKMFPSMGLNLETLSFLVFILILPLYSAVGPGFFLQRILAAKSERDAALSMGWFAVCHMILRSWPWVVVAAASLVYFPNIADGEQAYPAMINILLPVGLKGIMIASLLAAFMSTLDTHLNWGSSYLVNDVYQPFIAKGKPKKHYVLIARISMLLLVFVALAIASTLTSILDAYKYLGVMITGPAIILILRWYWWRINVWSEISVLLASVIIGNMLFLWLPDSPDADYFGVRSLLNISGATLIALIVTYLTTEKAPTTKVKEFYRRLRIQGPGWKRVAEHTGLAGLDDSLAITSVSCLSAIGALFSLMFIVGTVIFENTNGLIISTVIFIISSLVLKRTLGGTFKLKEDIT
ncbi:MAG: Na+:solute symporter [Gammaproteobacteria bacterium]|nr:Na+:solute symporter [Gammaproteobacteria bacterium]